MGLQATKDSPLGMTLEPFKVGISMLAADLYRNERRAGVPTESAVLRAPQPPSPLLHSAAAAGHVGLWVALRMRTERPRQAGTARHLCAHATASPYAQPRRSCGDFPTPGPTLQPRPNGRRRLPLQRRRWAGWCGCPPTTPRSCGTAPCAASTPRPRPPRSPPP